MFTGAQLWAFIQEEGGDAIDPTKQTQFLRWYNEGISRLGRWDEKNTTLSWSLAATSVALPGDFIQIVKLDYPSGTPAQDWRVFGEKLVLDNLNGATAACTNAVLYYWGERVPVLLDADTSTCTYAEDYAGIYYSMHRWFRQLASSRVHYTRYATLLGANAVSVQDLQNESDRCLQDFRDARDDLSPLQPAAFYPTSRYKIGL